jgi:hypothetical protein
MDGIVMLAGASIAIATRGRLSLKRPESFRPYRPAPSVYLQRRPCLQDIVRTLQDRQLLQAAVISG